MLTLHSIIHGDACFAYFNKIWGIPPRCKPLNRFSLCYDWLFAIIKPFRPNELETPKIQRYQELKRLPR